MPTIITASVDSGVVPHHPNIKDIYDNNAVIQLLKRLTDIPFWVAGGWTTALILAPRLQRNPLDISRNYYNDLDIYVESESQAETLISLLDTQDLHVTHSSDFAKSYETEFGYQFQIVKGFYGNHRIINSFDLVAAASAIDREGNLYFHKDLVHNHIEGILEFHNPWMISRVDENPSYFLVNQLFRIHKYCDRWGRIMSQEMMDTLLSIYDRHHGLTITKDRLYHLNSGALSEFSEDNINVWTICANIFLDHPLWDPDLDPHGKITGNGPDISQLTTATTDPAEPPPVAQFVDELVAGRIARIQELADEVINRHRFTEILTEQVYELENYRQLSFNSADIPTRTETENIRVGGQDLRVISDPNIPADQILIYDPSYANLGYLGGRTQGQIELDSIHFDAARFTAAIQNQDQNQQGDN